MKHNIILADDHQLFLEGVIRLIAQEKDFHVLYYAHNGKLVMNYLDQHLAEQVDLVITDISMPDVDGITLNNYIKEKRPEISTLVVSMHTDANMIDALIQNNVDGFLSKNADSEELLAAVKTILKGGKYFSEAVKQDYLKSVFNKEKETLEMLTSREKDVLKLIAEEYTTQEIADKLFLSKHTIESYRKNLILKLKVRNLAGLTRYAVKLGLLS
ncbi:DNA-binding response regulator, NarL/FixJ family, contains REC and HTH domains [Chitinophaga terrae (ex Kim and Jung 2007)]|uniref:DNA-binding response regulator, NarL/FixJ family, contains REC and HTH domains n=1 Tax=Chitinophaga terrae (ex Kim and Jung 2007) TaxID=408074 RepID=A0A1H4CZB0_9BACT|nr:response regulator transcription factor [Chitinophaga terrae (ex Kim and Jung 2007)]GEP90662.1 DNA-binding response regulator [Chitinophaga terrae (ex Kim and Jung 2007)]SEA65691.1 DNA-binding response regulator, NarL/FixJ family, contains REC and HTH domains [Chitinophaga terrae (ex Kim and Jung 2007)]